MEFLRKQKDTLHTEYTDRLKKVLLWRGIGTETYSIDDVCFFGVCRQFLAVMDTEWIHRTRIYDWFIVDVFTHVNADRGLL